MRDVEKALIDNLLANKQDAAKPLLAQLMKEPLGKMTQEFVSQDVLKKYSKTYHVTDSIRFRLLIETYLAASDGNLKEEPLNAIKSELKKIREKTFKSHGQGL